MVTYIYDGSYEGLLTCVFVAFETKTAPNAIVVEQQQQLTLVGDSHIIKTDDTLAARVATGIDARSNYKAATLVYKMFLSELPQIEMTIYHVIKIVVTKNNPAILENFANSYILKAAQVAKMIHREVHRMHAFVRFQKTKDGIFYAAIEPDFNVMPLIGEHFVRRYADQPWIIFDTKRHYGLHYDKQDTHFVTVDDPIFNFKSGTIQKDFIDHKEKIYQALWENYFASVNIKERKNIKLHLRHMPKRYWKYLIEKRVR